MAVAAPGQLNLNEYPSWGSRSVDCFEKLEQIGEGTYGSVFTFVFVMQFHYARLLVLLFLIFTIVQNRIFEIYVPIFLFSFFM